MARAPESEEMARAPESEEESIRILRDAECISRNEFCVCGTSKSLGGEHVINAVFSVGSLSVEECQQLANELNTAMRPVLERKRAALYRKAATKLKRYL